MKILLILALVVMIASSCNENEEILEKENRIREVPHTQTVKEVSLGEASTTIIDTGKNRVSNIKLACSAVTDTVLSPGDEFSFNNIVGKRSKERGYKDAPIIFHGEKSYGVGGGICQVSSTLYMAAINAGLKITEHHNHSESVSYAPDKKDATVVYGEKDLKFINNTENDIHIFAWVDENKVWVKLVQKNVEPLDF